MLHKNLTRLCKFWTPCLHTIDSKLCTVNQESILNLNKYIIPSNVPLPNLTIRHANPLLTIYMREMCHSWNNINLLMSHAKPDTYSSIIANHNILTEIDILESYLDFDDLIQIIGKINNKISRNMLFVIFQMMANRAHMQRILSAQSHPAILTLLDKYMDCAVYVPDIIQDGKLMSFVDKCIAVALTEHKIKISIDDEYIRAACIPQTDMLFNMDYTKKIKKELQKFRLIKDMSPWHNIVAERAMTNMLTYDYNVHNAMHIIKNKCDKYAIHTTESEIATLIDAETRALIAKIKNKYYATYV